MKKLIHSVALSLLVGLGASAAPVVKSAGSQAFSPGETVTALEKIDASSVKLTKINPGKKKVSGTPTADDFIGIYSWKGTNYLTNVIYPNEGVMTITKDSDTDYLLIDGFFSGATMKAYVENGRLYLPNQVVGYSSYYNEDMWFWNYSVEDIGDGYSFIKNNSSSFFFTMDSDGNLQSGNVDADKWNNHEYTAEELLENICFATCIVPSQDGFYWFCGFINCYQRNNIYDFTFNINEWDYVGMATFKDCWFPFYNEDVNNIPQYEVPLYSSKDTFGEYLLLNPYGPDTPYGDYNLSAKDGFIIFNISQSDFVPVIPVYSMTEEILEVPTPFYCCNYEGYSLEFDNNSKENIIQHLYESGREVSNFDVNNKTVHIYNPHFMYGSSPYAYTWNDYDNFEGYIIFPDNSTPETSNPYVPATPFAYSSITPGVVKTFDVILASESVITGLQNNSQIVNDWRIDDENYFLYIWDNTFLGGDPSYPGIGFDESQYDGYVSLDVNNAGWSGAGFYIGKGVDTSHWTDDTRLHVDYRTASIAPASVAFLVADGDNGGTPAKIAVGDDFNDGGVVYPSIAPGPGEEWRSFDISFAELKNLWPAFDFQSSDAWTGNILSFLAGGVSGTNISLDCIYFYTPTGTIQPPTPVEGAYYIIGDNVNGKNWELAQPDAIFEDLGNGIYRWSGEWLGTGFKINDGTWSNYYCDLGGYDGYFIAMNTPYPLVYGGSNIEFEQFTGLSNPIVEFDANNLTVTLLGGTPEGVLEVIESHYYLGINSGWIEISVQEGIGTFAPEDPELSEGLVLEKGFYFAKTETLSNGTFNTRFYGANPSYPYITLNETYDLERHYTGDMQIYFLDFDAVSNPIVTVDFNTLKITKFEGKPYISAPVEDSDVVYMVYQAYDEEYSSFNLMTSLGDGQYSFRPESLYGMFYFELYHGDDRVFLGSPDGKALQAGVPTDYVEGNIVFQIPVNEEILNPTVVLDTINMQFTISSGSSQVTRKVEGTFDSKIETVSPRSVNDTKVIRVINGQPIKK